MDHIEWHKIDHIEWRKSSRSAAAGHCVEVAHLDGGTLVRNSRDRQGPVLRFTTEEWSAFIGGATQGEFNAG